jgi:hypothetical protein
MATPAICIRFQIWWGEGVDECVLRKPFANCVAWPGNEGLLRHSFATEDKGKLFPREFDRSNKKAFISELKVCGQ